MKQFLESTNSTTAGGWSKFGRSLQYFAIRRNRFFCRGLKVRYFIFVCPKNILVLQVRSGGGRWGGVTGGRGRAGPGHPGRSDDPGQWRGLAGGPAPLLYGGKHMREYKNTKSINVPPLTIAYHYIWQIWGANIPAHTLSFPVLYNISVLYVGSTFLS